LELITARGARKCPQQEGLEIFGVIANSSGIVCLEKSPRKLPKHSQIQLRIQLRLKWLKVLMTPSFMGLNGFGVSFEPDGDESPRPLALSERPVVSAFGRSVAARS
jgi:hypothetical protein